MRRKIWLAPAVLGFVAAPALRADTTTLTLSNTNFNIVAGTPVTHTVNSVPAANNLLGISLAGNWTSVANEAWSDELLVGMTAPGGTTIDPVFYGGVGNENPFTFPGPSFGTNSFAVGITPVNAPTGNYTFTFDQDFAGSTANLQNAAVTLYFNPVSVTGNTTGGATAARPVESGLAVSTTGSAVPTQLYTLTPNTTGRHMVAVTTTDANYDTFITVYGPGGYVSTTPLVNLIAASDDDPNLGLAASTITVELTAGDNYTVVVTGFNNADFGAFTLFAAGPGSLTLTPVPEPTAVVGVGAVALLGGWAARRKRVAVA